ncbi:MAG: twin-arginine translocase TatA/TatE family subunit [Gemmatimonadetes bacterium]|nr:twin-arginine translocase TatA/TatE family subunit [Gemmatimonadota bacterium]
MFGNLGMGEIVGILVIVLLVFGARRLPEIGSAMGKGIREFKKSMREVTEDVDRPAPPPEPRPLPPADEKERKG